MKSTLLIKVLTLTAFLVLLSGCGGGGNNDNSGSSSNWDEMIWDKDNWA